MGRAKTATATTDRFEIPGRGQLERALFRRLAKLLRLRNEPGSAVEYAIAVSEGLAAAAADALVSEGLLARKELAAFLPLRTLSHRRLREQRLKPDESDAIARAGKVIVLAEQVFADRARAARWLRSSKKSLLGHTPLEMVASSEGARLVEEALIRIDEGYFA